MLSEAWPFYGNVATVAAADGILAMPNTQIITTVKKMDLMPNIVE
jgi:hypothetical protein